MCIHVQLQWRTKLRYFYDYDYLLGTDSIHADITQGYPSLAHMAHQKYTYFKESSELTRTLAKLTRTPPNVTATPPKKNLLGLLLSKLLTRTPPILQGVLLRFYKHST